MTVMIENQPTARTAADLPEGTPVQGADGRMGTVNGYDVGRVTNTEHPNYGREYVGVTWDASESIPWGQHSRPFVDELTIVEAPKRKLPDLSALANPKKADSETIAEIHASRCIECKGAGCPECGYKGVQRTVCPAHHIVDKRGSRATELGGIPTCEPGITYGAWSEGAGGFVYTGDCATEVANWAADELRTLAKDDDTDTIQILAICPDHEEQPKNGCEECGTEDTNDDSGEDDSFQRSAHIGRIADEFGDEG